MPARLARVGVPVLLVLTRLVWGLVEVALMVVGCGRVVRRMSVRGCGCITPRRRG